MTDYIAPENALVPDLRSHFKHVTWRPMPHSCGHLIGSDWSDRPAGDPVFGIYKNCGLWSRDEAALLWRWSEQASMKTGFQSASIEFGSHTGWCTLHMAMASETRTVAIEPLFRGDPLFHKRFAENVGTSHTAFGQNVIWEYGCRSDESNNFLIEGPFCIVSIDGDHDQPWPMHDAMLAADNLTETGVILLHDAWGKPVWSVAEALKARGFQARFYSTPHGLIAAWRGDLTPPDHTPDPRVDWDSKKRAQPGFPWR